MIDDGSGCGPNLSVIFRWPVCVSVPVQQSGNSGGIGGDRYAEAIPVDGLLVESKEQR